MFGNAQKKVTTLERRVRVLESELDTLRAQVAGLSQGVPVSQECLLGTAAFSPVPAAQLDDFRGRVPSVLLLDVRPDADWEAGHIPEAKHVVAAQLAGRLMELHDPLQPVVVVGQDGNDALEACQVLASAGFRFVFHATGGMAAYPGKTVRSSIAPLDRATVAGSDRALVERVAQLIDADVRPGLVRDGGDLQLVAVEGGVVTVRMIGACHGCGAKKNTLNHGIRTYLIHMIPEITEIAEAGAA